jgi:hypothetical protein
MWLQEMGGWESIEVVRRYAYLAENGTNMAQGAFAELVNIA